SGELTEARAIANVRQIRADMREARVLGPGIASLTDAYSRSSERVQAALLPIKKFIVEKLAAFMEKLAAWLEKYGPEIAGILEATMQGWQIFGDFALLKWGQLLEDLAKLPERVAQAMKDAQKLDDNTPLQWLRQLSDEAQQMMQGVIRDPNVGALRPDHFNLPAFQFP